MTNQSSSSTPKRIPPQPAAEEAAKYLKSFIPDALEVRVEEVEFVSNAPPGKARNHWRITLSYCAGGVSWGPRTYKLFQVDADSGEVLSMRMRPS